MRITNSKSFSRPMTTTKSIPDRMKFYDLYQKQYQKWPWFEQPQWSIFDWKKTKPVLCGELPVRIWCCIVYTLYSVQCTHIRSQVTERLVAGSTELPVKVNFTTDVALALVSCAPSTTCESWNSKRHLCFYIRHGPYKTYPCSFNTSQQPPW